MFPRNNVLFRYFRRLQAENEGARPRSPSYSTPHVVRLPPTLDKAAKAMRVPKTDANRKYWYKGTPFDQTAVHPDIIEFTKKFVSAMSDRGIPYWPFELYRTPERQAELHALGRSKAPPFKSAHQWGCAVDLVHAQKPWKLTSLQYRVVGMVGKEVARKANIPIVWGGDWSFYDPAHWELAYFREYRDTFHRVEQWQLTPDFFAEGRQMIRASAKR